MIRTLKFALHYQPANSQAIGYYATQQNAAYNAAVDVLNQEPDLPKRSGRHHPDALNKRITAWRQRNRQRADAPYYIHQQGAEEAWEANQRMRQARDDRQQRIAQAIANGEEPKQRDIRPHRRTLAHRARKKGPLSLTITDRRLFQVSNEGQTLSSRQCGFTVTLRAHRNLFLDIRSIRLVPVKNYGTRTPLGRRHYCLHVQVAVPEPVPIESVDIENPEDILGADRGTKNHLAVSSGHRAHNPRSGKQRTRRRKHQHDIAGKPRGSKRRHHAVAKAREQSSRYTQRRDQDLRRQIRDILLRSKAAKMVSIESLHPISMMASARGTSAAPGKNVAAKRKLNESLAESAIGYVGKLLRDEAAKLGIPTVSVPPQGTSQTCPRCGDRQCGLKAHADWTAAVIIRNRTYVRHCEWQSGYTPEVLTAPTGWREQPSGSEPRQPRLGLELSVFKPEGTATSSHGNRVRGPRPARRIQAASQGARSVTNSVSHGIHSRGYSELSVENLVSGFRAQFVNTL